MDSDAIPTKRCGSALLARVLAAGLALAACGDPPAPPQAAVPSSHRDDEVPTVSHREPVPGPQASDTAPGQGGERGAREDVSAEFAPGTLVGRVYVEASVPRPGPLELDSVQERHCSQFGGLPALDQRKLVTDAAGGVSGAVVWVEVPGAVAQPLGQPALVKQANRFQPSVLLVRPGALVRFTNADPCASTLQLAGALELTRPLEAGEEHWQAFPDVGEVAVHDAVHPWMEAWIVVRAAPQAAVTGTDGSYELPGLPPGEQVLHVWHPNLAPAAVPFELAPGGVQRLEVGLAAN